jgi:predicted Zn-dependent protease
MRFSCPSAYLATLVLVVYLALPAPAATFAADASGADNARVEAYRANLLTPDEERVVGARLAFLYEQRHPALKDQDVQARLRRIAARLRAAIPAQALDIRVIQGVRPEAVSFPPGRIFITVGLLKLATTDDELAAVIAHEAAHMANHHLARLIALALMLPSNERERFPARAAIIKGQAVQFTFPAALAPERLRYEMEADEIAVGWLETAGYNTRALAILLDNLKSRLSIYAQPERAALSARVRLLNQQSSVSAR